jgi:prepilin-type N-terminal cleavage/methylation domain-containing protein
MHASGLQHRNSALTLLELLVAIAIIAMLIAIMLPAVQRVRAAAQRQTCNNQLRQIGVALHSYESSYRLFPTALMSDRDGPGAGLMAYSTFSRLIGFLEQSELFNSINFYVPTVASSYNEPTNSTAIRTRVGGYLCPSDTYRLAGEVGGTSYRVNLGSEWHPTVKRNGAFAIFDWLGTRDFPDGLATTIAVSEKLRGDDLPTSFLSHGDSRYIRVFAIHSLDELLAHCSSAGLPTPHFSRGGYSWMLSGHENTWYNHFQPPNPAMEDCTHGGPGTTGQYGVYSATSNHSGGVHSLTMDGAVRFVSEHISVEIWRALGTRNGSETVDVSSF